MKRSLPPVRVQGARRGSEVLSLERIIPHLQRAQRQPDGSYMACCPAHDDRTPSLHLSEKEGVLLWRCFAGCSQEAVGEALRRLAGVDTVPATPTNAPRGCTIEQLAQAKLLDPELLRQWHVGDGRRAGVDAVYIRYLDEQGEVVSTQWRINLAGDRFRRDGSPTLYGLWRLGEYSGQNLWCCEGTSDTWVLWHAGLPALGFPNNNPPESLLQHFWGVAERFSNIYIIPDGDAEGQVLLQKLAQTCPPDLRERVRIVSLHDGVKDAGDLWLACNGDADAFKNRLRECLNSSHTIANIDVATVATVATVVTVATDELIPAVVFDDLPEESAPAVVPGLFYEERITFVAGESGIGKTTFMLEICDALEQGGTLWGSVQLQPARILWVPYDHNPRSLKSIANTYYGERPRPNLLFVDSKWQEPLTPETLSRWRELLERTRPNLLVVDTAFDLFVVQDEIKDSVARANMQLLRDLIEGTHCAVALLHHPNKGMGDSTSTRALSGHHAWAGKSDCIAYLRFLKKEGLPPDRFVRLTVAKNREGDSWTMDFERIARRFRPVELSDLPPNEWSVVRCHLEAHGQATYDELLTTLIQRGFKMTITALQRRVQRWCEKGVLTSRREGFPAKTIIRLAQIQMNTPVTTDTTVTTVTTDTTRYSNCVVTDDDADFHALLETLTRPDDPFALDEDDLAPMVELWAQAQQRNFPRLELPAYDLLIPHGRAAWLTFLNDCAGTPAVPLALQRLTLSDAGATAPAPTPALDANGAGAFPDSATAGVVN